MEKSKRRNIVVDKDIVLLLAERTSVSIEVVHTILHYYERIILHKAMKGDNIIVGRLFRIFHLKNNVYIELTETAKKYIDKGRVK
ncbi:MAG: hypothetical protein KKH92_00430 [Firmicutes bacterium]|nr:hypothetical protein [Bacillota bacterium]